MSRKLMIVEDDQAMRRLLDFLLRKEGFDVVAYEDGREALEALPVEQPDLLLLDWSLPGMNGIEVCRQIRQKNEFNRLPVLMLTVNDQPVDRLEALSTGADGYLSKPFESTELLLTIRAFLRLTEKPSGQLVPERLSADGLTLDPATYMVTVRGEELPLTRSETAVLQFLMTHAGSVFSADELANNILGPSGGVRSVDAIHAQVRNLRAKVEEDAKQPHYIVTIGRKGYSFRG